MFVYKKAGLLAMSFHRLETCGNACNATTAAQASNKLTPSFRKRAQSIKTMPCCHCTESRHTSCMKWMQDKLQTNENMEKLQRAAYTCATEKPLLASLKQQHGASATNQASKVFSDHWEQHHS